MSYEIRFKLPPKLDIEMEVDEKTYKKIYDENTNSIVYAFSLKKSEMDEKMKSALKKNNRLHGEIRKYVYGKRQNCS